MVTDERSLNSCVSSHHWDGALKHTHTHTHTQVEGSVGGSQQGNGERRSSGWHAPVSNMSVSPVNRRSRSGTDCQRTPWGRTWVQSESSELPAWHLGGRWRKCAVFSPNWGEIKGAEPHGYMHHLKTTTNVSPRWVLKWQHPPKVGHVETWLINKSYPSTMVSSFPSPQKRQHE